MDAFEMWCGEDSRESPAVQGDQTSHSKLEYSLEGVLLRSNTLASGCEQLTH